MGLYTNKVDSQAQYSEIVSKILGINDHEHIKVECFCDDGEGEIRQYQVFKISIGEQVYVLKRSDEREIFIYEHLLTNPSFFVPPYLGHAIVNDTTWLLMSYIEGSDLREFTTEMALACARSIAKIQNAYWQTDTSMFQTQKMDDRFERYCKRIQQRAQCLVDEPELHMAYQQFLQRQLTEPRTLCNGDFLQYNGIFCQGEVYVIDWAFGGIMPYALDIARLIAHGSLNRFGFPFYMNDQLRSVYVEKLYEYLDLKPDKMTYYRDIELAMLNEYIEFIEKELKNSTITRDAYFDDYYVKALYLARHINQKTAGFYGINMDHISFDRTKEQ